MKNVFVAGGAGFIGRHLIARLNEDTAVEKIVVFDKDRFAGVRSPKMSVYQTDLCMNSTIWEAMRGCDTVFHLASNADIARAERDPDIDFRDGTVLTRNILEAMRITKAKQMIYFSGSGVYGDHPGITLKEDFGPCIPNSPYGASKLASEAMIAAYSSMLEIDALILRPANIVGPGQTHGVCYDFVHALKDHPDHLDILGDGSQRKSYIHVESVLEAVLFLANRRYLRTRFDVFNIASCDEISVNRIALFAILACCKGKTVPVVTWGEGPRGWAGDIPQVKLDTSKLQMQGWCPGVTSSESVRAALKALYES